MTDPAVVLALTETLCPSVNGACAQRLTRALETTHGTDVSNLDLVEEDDKIWIRDGLQASGGRVSFWQESLGELAAEGISLHTVNSLGYPAILRMIHNAPPFLFVNGTLTPADNRAVAIVGTRSAGPEGLDVARQLAGRLSAHQITIVSGLADGIDAAAHTGALEAGGRTIAVFGTGINKLYPAKNRQLALRVKSQGACVSQFLPDQTPAKWTFPVRNIVTSGMSVGSVIVEAGETSGAKRQAFDALAHGKRVFLVTRLVEQQEWARKLIGSPGVTAINDIDEIVATVADEVFGPIQDSEAELASAF